METQHLQTCTSRANSPHSAKVPASYGRVICCGKLTAVVVGAPFARGELQLAFPLQRRRARDLQSTATPPLRFASRNVNSIQITCDRLWLYSEFNQHNRHYQKSFSLQATLKTTMIQCDSAVIFWPISVHQLPADLRHAET